MLFKQIILMARILQMVRQACPITIADLSERIDVPEEQVKQMTRLLADLGLLKHLCLCGTSWVLLTSSGLRFYRHCFTDGSLQAHLV